MTTIFATLAQLPSASADNASSWVVILALGTVVNLGVGFFTLVRMSTGKSGERQIEPTAIAAMAGELKTFGATLAKLDREMGMFLATTAATQRELDNLRKEVDGAHTRISGISRELAATVSRVDGLEKRETDRT